MRIHILGASGSGTTTLAEELAKELKCSHYDSDDYFWEKTEPPFQQKRPVEERQNKLETDLLNSEDFVLSGSLCGWGDKFIPLFDLVVFLWIPEDIRISRILNRESERYGEKIREGGSMYESSQAFIKWASEYDTGDVNMRSKIRHELWLSELCCDVIRIEEDIDVVEKLSIILKNM